MAVSLQNFFDLRPLNSSKRALNFNPTFLETPCIDAMLANKNFRKYAGFSFFQNHQENHLTTRLTFYVYPNMSLRGKFIVSFLYNYMYFHRFCWRDQCCVSVSACYQNTKWKGLLFWVIQPSSVRARWLLTHFTQVKFIPRNVTVLSLL